MRDPGSQEQIDKSTRNHSVFHSRQKLMAQKTRKHTLQALEKNVCSERLVSKKI